MEPIAIDLLWVRPSRVGGTEPYTRTLLDAFRELPKDEFDFNFYLLVSCDNADTFAHYCEDSRFHLLMAPCGSHNIGRRILWQMMHQNHLLRRNKIRRCFTPVYVRPFFNGGVKYLNVIHDIQAYHYPQYHPGYEIAYSKLCWNRDVHASCHLIVTSAYVKQDLIKCYGVKDEQVDVIPIAVPSHVEKADWSEVSAKYGIEEGEYYYTVSQLIPHKNLPTVIRVMHKIVKEYTDMPHKLLLSGISMNGADEVNKLIHENELEEYVCLTGYIGDEERNALYAHCKAFLFPSVFEGFGMPPIEAMVAGATVVTTECTSIPEVSQHIANYVNNPYDELEWIRVMREAVNRSNELDLMMYDKDRIAREYMRVIRKWLG